MHCESPELVRPVLLGRARAPKRSPGVQVLSVLSDTGDITGLEQPTRTVQSWVYTHPCERLWNISSSVTEVVRNAVVPTPPLTEQQLLTDPTASPRSALVLSVTAARSDGSNTYLIDLGQPFELYAEALQVELLAPPDSSVGHERTVTGLIADTLAVARALQIEESRGVRSALLTETYPAPVGPLDVLVPSGADQLTVYSNLGFGFDFQVDWYRGDPAVGVSIGSAFLPAAALRVLPLAVPSASHLRIPPIGGAQEFTLVWRIVP